MRRWRVLSGLQSIPITPAQYTNRSPESGTHYPEHEAVPDGMVVWNAFADVEITPSE